MDISALYTYLTSTKFGPGGPSGLEVENISNFISNTAIEGTEILNKYNSIQQNKIKSDSTYCNHCEKNVHNDDVGKHAINFRFKKNEKIEK